MARWLVVFVVAAILVVGSVAGVRARSGFDGNGGSGGGTTSILGQTAEQAGDDANNIGGLIVFTVLGAVWLGGGALLVRSARRSKRQALAATAGAAAASEPERPLPA